MIPIIGPRKSGPQLFSLPCGLVRRLRADPFLKDDAGMTARGNTHGGFAPVGFTDL